MDGGGVNLLEDDEARRVEPHLSGEVGSVGVDDRSLVPDRIGHIVARELAQRHPALAPEEAVGDAGEAGCCFEGAVMGRTLPVGGPGYGRRMP